MPPRIWIPITLVAAVALLLAAFVFVVLPARSFRQTDNLSTLAGHFVITRLTARRAGVDDRDISQLVQQNWISVHAVSLLIAPSAPDDVKWLNSTPGDHRPTLLTEHGHAVQIPAGPVPFRLGELVVLPLSDDDRSREWSLVVLSGAGRSDGVIVSSAERSGFLPDAQWAEAVAEQNALREARGAAPMWDLRALPDLLKAGS